MPTPVALGIAGSISAPSRSGLLVQETLRHLAAGGAQITLLDLTTLSANALLGREKDLAFDAALASAASADILVLGTPIYRAAYTGQLKAFFDLLPRDALAGAVVGLIATGAGPGHLLAIDHTLRPLVASLAGLSAAHAIYATDADLPDYKTGVIPESITTQVAALADELLAISSGLMGAT